MKKVLKIETNGTVTVVDMDQEFDYKWAAKIIGCSYIEIVRPKRLANGLIMIVDEEGLLKRNFVNIVGSWLYQTDLHHEPIVGDLIIMGEEMGDDGPECAGLDDDAIDELKKDLGNPQNLKVWRDAVARALQ